MSSAPPRGPKRQRLQQEGENQADMPELLAGVRAGTVSRALLEARLLEHVERIDTDLALEYQVRCGMQVLKPTLTCYTCPCALLAVLCTSSALANCQAWLPTLLPFVILVQVQQGMALASKQQLYLAIPSATAQGSAVQELHAGCCVLHMLQPLHTG